MLRLPRTLTYGEKVAQVNSVILALGLKNCRNTKIGNDEKRGISGGEKRRVSIAMQMLTNPSILLLDEPTSGLDSFMARNVMETLVGLAEQGRTVICTIHQPRSDIFQMFDYTLLLSKGRAVYYGSTKDVADYFGSLGYTCPKKTNPADFMLDIVSMDSRNQKAEAEATARIKKLVEYHATSEFHKNGISPASPPPARMAPVPRAAKKAGFFMEILVLFLRCVKNLYRDRPALIAGLVEAITVGTMIGAVFYAIPDDLVGIQARGALFYVVCSLQAYIMLTYNTYKACQELPVFDRERQDNLYGAMSFVFARTFASLPLDIIYPCIFSCILYWLAGLRPDFQHFAIFTTVNTMHIYVAMSWGWMCASITRNFALAALLANGISIFYQMSCGFLMNPLSFPQRIVWFKHIDATRYAYELMMVNEFEDRSFSCPDLGSPECYLYQGDQILSNAGISDRNLGFLFGMLLSSIVIFRAAMYIFLALFPRAPSMHAPLPPPSAPTRTHAQHYDTFVTRLMHSSMPLNIALQDVGVRVAKEDRQVRKACGEGEGYTQVLRKVTGTLRTGELVMLMGGSGSGKTTLLNAIAGRGANTEMTGKVLVNGSDMRDELQFLTAYVLQNDYLHACLTVRECLQYIAELRLPSTMTHAEKTGRVDEIIHELGLRDCKNTLIGDDVVRGISGGEKRRVSIAAQLLTDPSVLLLDEPTSGLDAFTAHNIIDTLKRIARRGRIVLCSIHQPRSDIFHLFDNIILLTKGNVAYFGPSRSILDHFAKVGHICPNDSNPADFLLDVTSIDDRDVNRERESTTRVENIVSQWVPVVSSDDDALKTVSYSATNLQLLVKKMNPFYRAVPILMKRSLRNMLRQPLFMLSRVLQAIAFASILAIYYTPLGNDQLSIQNRIGLLYMSCSVVFVGMLNSTAFFPPERNVFYREHADGSYSSLAFFVMYTASEIWYDMFMAISFSVIVYFIVGIEFTITHFSMFSFVIFLLIFSGESVGAVLNMLIYDVGFANSLTSTVLSFFGTMGGLLSTQMFTALKWINTISIMKYATVVITLDHFEGLEFTCDAAYCPLLSGDDVLERYGFEPSQKWVAFGVMVGLAVGYRVLGAIILHFLKKKYAQ